MIYREENATERERRENAMLLAENIIATMERVPSFHKFVNALTCAEQTEVHAAIVDACLWDGNFDQSNNRKLKASV